MKKRYSVDIDELSDFEYAEYLLLLLHQYNVAMIDIPEDELISDIKNA